MFNNIVSSIRQHVEQVSYLQETIDPISLVLRNLASNPNWKVKINNDESQVTNLDQQKNQSIHIKIDENDYNSTGETANKKTNLNIFSNKRSPNFPNKPQKLIIQKLKAIPIYTVVNNFDEVIVSSPREENQQNTLNHLRNFYNDLFFWTHDEGAISILLFFMNEQDAGSYLHEICKKDPKEAEKLGLTVKQISLDTFYKFNRTSPQKIQARLIGDLNEIDSVIKKIEKSNIKNINPKQRYSKFWFQGIPVYKLKLNIPSNNNSLINYKVNKDNEESYVFFREQDALIAWKTFISKNKNINSNITPNLEVYNLENLLLDLEKEKNISNLILVPPYELCKDKLTTLPSVGNEYSSQTRLLYSMKLKFENVKRFYKGLIWLITSDTLPSEDNSW